MSTNSPMPKPDDRADHRAGQQPDRHHHQRREVGADAEDRDLRDRRLLDARRSRSRQQRRAGARGVDDSLTARCARWVPGVGSGQDLDGVEVAQVSRRRDLTCVVEQVVLVGVGYLPDRDPGRVQRVERAGLEAGGDDLLADRDRARAAGRYWSSSWFGLPTAGYEHAGVAVLVLDLGGDGERVVGDQGDDRDGRGDVRDLADQRRRRRSPDRRRGRRRPSPCRPRSCAYQSVGSRAITWARDRLVGS